MHNCNYIKIILTVLSLFSFLSCNEKIEKQLSENYVIDDLHNKIYLTSAPQKIVTLAPNLTELVFALGEGNKIIGNTSYCNFPDSAKNIKNVADLLTVNFEKITELKPDLIFITAEGNSQSDYVKLCQLGFNVFVSNPRHYNGIKKTLIDMGKIFNIENEAEKMAYSWDERIARIKDKSYPLVNNSVMFLISTNPIFSVGKKSFINQILTYAGLKNITSDSEISYPMLSREDVLLKNPDYILLYETNRNDINDLLNKFPEWNTLSAFINKRVYFINADLYSRPGPRFVDAVENLAELIYKKDY